MKIVKFLIKTVVLISWTGIAHSQTVFFDDFNRSDGSIGNGWFAAVDNPSADLAIFDGTVSTRTQDAEASFFRQVDHGGAISVSMDLTPHDGRSFPGRFQNSIYFGNNGRNLNGYGIAVSRTSEGFDNSQVVLVFGDTAIEAQASSFQYVDKISVEVNLNFDRSISGTISDEVNRFDFSFSAQEVSLDGDNVSIRQNRINSIISNPSWPSIDNVRIQTTPPDPIDELNDLISVIVNLNLRRGISNSLDAKLDSAIRALDDQNAQNDIAAVNSLHAFINAVEAQRDRHISSEDADLLTQKANQIIELLLS